MEKELRKQTKLLVEIRMSYPLPMTKSKKKPVRFSTYSSSLEVSPGDIPNKNNPANDSPNLHTNITLTNSQSNCDRLVELIQSVLQNTSSIEEGQVLTTRNDLQIYVRRRGDFQVRLPFRILLRLTDVT